ncbi:MAG: hypothetical protein AB8E15_10560 [Bdellovibrionales bacterium]
MDIEKIRKFERCGIEANFGLPECTWIDNKNLVMNITENTQGSASNCVYRSIFEKKDLESKVGEIINKFAKHNLNYRWHISPLTEPANTESYLKSLGMKELYKATTMIKASSQEFSSDVSNIKVKTAEMNDSELFSKIFIKAWGLDDSHFDEINSTFLYSLGTNINFKPYIAYYKNEPAACSTMIFTSNGAYLASGTVLKEFRNNRIYKAMVEKRSIEANINGIDTLVIQAKENTSKPICLKMGFEEIYTYTVLEKATLPKAL